MLMAAQFTDDYKGLQEFRKAQGVGSAKLPESITRGMSEAEAMAAKDAFAAAGGGEKGLKAAERAIKKTEEKAEKNIKKVESAKSIVSQSDAVIDLVKKIEESEGFEAAVGAKGASSLFGLLDSPIAGTKAADVAANIETLEAKNFLSSIKDFKDAGGAGALSDSEGKKLGAALTNLSRKQSEESFKRNLKVVKELAAKAKRNAMKQVGDDLPEEVQNIGSEQFTTKSGLTFTVK
jgi:hypothetical protein